MLEDPSLPPPPQETAPPEQPIVNEPQAPIEPEIALPATPQPEPIPEPTPPIQEPEIVAPAPEPPAPEPIPVPEPAPEIVPPPATPEPIVETPPVVVEPAPQTKTPPAVAPTPPVASPPTIVQTTEPTPAKKEEALSAPSPQQEEATSTEQQAETPAAAESQPVNGIPQKILDLTPEELDAARRLWAREHIAEAQKQANKNRHARMMSRMAEIEKVVKQHPSSSIHEIANKVQLSEKLTSGYVEKLVHAGRLRAEGNTTNRRYS